MGVLHELLAVEKDAKDVLTKILEETLKTFSQRSSHFVESRKTYRPFKEGDKDIPEQEFSPMATTVKDKLDYAQGSIIRFIDIELQKESSNQKATADVIVELPDGKTETVIEAAPVTWLVQMETLLERIRKVYSNIPTLNPNEVWNEDKTRDNVWITKEPIIKVRTKKVPTVIEKSKATDKFPAQTEIVHTDEPVGEFTQSSASGALSPKQKSQLLDRIDRLVTAVKIARSKANGQEVESKKIGLNIFNFINQGFTLK